MIGYCPLASGSKGNCVYLGTDKTKILIDAGISGKAIKERLSQIGVSLEQIDAILITHDHGDHINGLRVLAYKYQIPIIANTDTAKGIVNTFGKCPQFKIFTTNEIFSFQDLEIDPFPILHDTLDPVAFTIKTEKHKLGFCTDLGFATSLVKAKLKDCDYLYLEANHEPQMVIESKRSHFYKTRVLGRTGHLSNQACGELLKEVCCSKLKHVHLAHLSQECNHPKKVIDTITSVLDKENIHLDLSIAFQDRLGKAILFEN